jgi:hypothetical protein
VVTVHDNGTVTRNAEYYTIGHLSRFVQPGAWRVASSSFGTTGWNGMVMDAAFVNPDGSTAVVVHNEHDNPRSFAIAVGDHSFDYTLPGGALATFTWPATKAFDNGLTLVDPITTSVAGSTGDAAVAADDDGATAWKHGPTSRLGTGCRSISARPAGSGRLCSTLDRRRTALSQQGKLRRTRPQSTGSRSVPTANIGRPYALPTAPASSLRCERPTTRSASSDAPSPETTPGLGRLPRCGYIAE